MASPSARVQRGLREVYRYRGAAPLRFVGGCRGTARREWPENLRSGLRSRPTFNPAVRLSALESGQRGLRPALEAEASAGAEPWSPLRLRTYTDPYRPAKTVHLPAMALSGFDELGDLVPPKLGGEDRRLAKMQYALHGVPWVYDELDAERREAGEDAAAAAAAAAGPGATEEGVPVPPRVWKARKLRETLRNYAANEELLTLAHKKEKRDKRRLSWWERAVETFASDQAVRHFSRVRKVPPLLS